MAGRILPGFVGLAFVALGVGVEAFSDENWPQWRGPALNGTAGAVDLLVVWSETQHVVWKTAFPRGAVRRRSSGRTKSI